MRVEQRVYPRDVLFKPFCKRPSRKWSRMVEVGPDGSL